MPLDAWVLLFCAVGLGLTLELTFYLGRRRHVGPGGTDTAPGEDPGEPAPDGSNGDAGGSP